MTDHQLICHDTQRVDVGAYVHWITADLFGRHVGRGAGGDGDPRRLGQALGAAEIADDDAVTVEQEVRRLDVSVQNAVLMQNLDRAGSLLGDIHGGLQVHGADQVIDAAAADEVHDKVRTVLNDPDVKHANYSVIDDATEDPGLFKEAFAYITVVRPIVGQDLDRDLGLELVVPSAPHGRESSNAVHGVQAVTSEISHSQKYGGHMGPAELAAARSGDPVAMDALLRGIYPVVLKRCSRLLPYPADAEEAAQDALLAVATKLDTYTGTGSFEGWVNAIATNRARSTYRSLKARGLTSPSSEIPDTADTARTSVIAGTRLDLLEAIEALEEAHPETVNSFMLRELADYTYDEVATATAVPMGTVKARIHTARQFVRKWMRESDNIQPTRRV